MSRPIRKRSGGAPPKRRPERTSRRPGDGGRPQRTPRSAGGAVRRPEGAPRRPPRAPARAAELIYGLNAVEAALVAQRRPLHVLYLKSGTLSPALDALRELAEDAGLPVNTHSPGELDALAHSPNNQGAVLRCGPLPVLDDRAALARATAWREAGAAESDRGTPDTAPPLLLALDQVEDPRNLGAIVRAGAAFGAAGLVLPRDHSAPLSAAASSASAGALERFAVYEVANLARFLEQARRGGYWVVGAAADDGEPLAGYTHDRPLVVVLGNEGRGLRPLVERACDQLLTIPLPGADRGTRGGETGGVSLNVASAAAVLLYQLMTYR